MKICEAEIILWGGPCRKWLWTCQWVETSSKLDRPPLKFHDRAKSLCNVNYIRHPCRRTCLLRTFYWVLKLGINSWHAIQNSSDIYMCLLNEEVVAIFEDCLLDLLARHSLPDLESSVSSESSQYNILVTHLWSLNQFYETCEKNKIKVWTIGMLSHLWIWPIEVEEKERMLHWYAWMCCFNWEKNRGTNH